MPAFEFSVLLKVMPREEVASALKRIGTLLMDKGVVIQKLENHGTKDLPFRMKSSGKSHTKGSYFIFRAMATPRIFDEIMNDCKEDVDLLRYGFCSVPTDLPGECTLDDEMQPPALRKSVQQLLEDGKKHKDQTKPIYKHLRFHTYYHDFM